MPVAINAILLLIIPISGKRADDKKQASSSVRAVDGLLTQKINRLVQVKKSAVSQQPT